MAGVVTASGIKIMYTSSIVDDPCAVREICQNAEDEVGPEVLACDTVIVARFVY